jgi:hypothetical protein
MLYSLFESISVRFPSDYSLSESVSRMQGVSQPWRPLRKVLPNLAVGRVGADDVKLWRARSNLRNDFKPCFYGRFVEVEGRIVLEGSFGLAHFTKAFMFAWFGFGLLWTLMAIFIFTQDPGNTWVFPLAGLGVLLGGVAVIALGVRMAQGDVEWLAERIRSALTAP